ncbi:MAG: hypothetical protein LBB89_02040 [Treponema sp.]|jgi:hypothetical protein|nr:hypothetical protein [Treponema sp.]
MKKLFLISVFLILIFSSTAYSQGRVISPSLNYLGTTDDEQEWKYNCNNWKRTIRGMTGQLPSSVDRTAVQYLIEYVGASSKVSNMKLQVYDVWAIEYFGSHIVFIWLTGYDKGTWTYKSMNILTY